MSLQVPSLSGACRPPPDPCALMKVLLVNTRRDGKNIYYSLASPQALAVPETLYQQFCGPSKAAAGRARTPAKGRT